MMDKATPRPWRADLKNEIVYGADGSEVADCSYVARPSGMAAANTAIITDAVNIHTIALAAIAYTEEIMRGAENVAAWENLRETVLAWKASQIEAAELADGVVKEIEVL